MAVLYPNCCHNKAFYKGAALYHVNISRENNNGVDQTGYCKFRNFCENFIFANSVKDIFASLIIRK